ncbi:protein phosphatase 1 regulatory subunit 14C [Herpailurus yagouaroundi]|uniref:protein phosphatase 1 regulatory subunit 14C n=1 Tax=Herpailurus yagouaroundi TaxID=1608482 RepID=UPI001AD70F61|nr:protein phosphatase 1 regulatory subunit 14C [Puma yagouaroundi]
MSVATGSSEAAGGAGGGGGARVFFQSPRGGAGGSPGSSGGSGSSREDSAPVATAAAAGQVQQQQQQQQQQRRHQQGKVTVKYDRKELRKRLVLEEWIVEQLGQLYGCEVLGRGAGRVGGLARPTVPTRGFSSSGSRLRTSPTPGDPTLGARRRAFSLQGALWRRGATVGSPCLVPGARRAAGPLHGSGEG